MENFSYSSYPEYGESSPPSREIDVDNAAAALDIAAPPVPAAAAKVKLMCSYGGKIQPRHHDNQLSYVGGETKIVAVDRTVRYPELLSKLASLSGAAADEVCYKYQLPGEDLDALISVTNDEDLEHMMIEYDRLLRSSVKPVARLRLFLFPLTSPLSNSSADTKSDRQWFVDALNSVPAMNPTVVSANHIPLDSIPPPPPTVMVSSTSPDYLFGLEYGFVAQPPPLKITDQARRPPLPQPQQQPEHVAVEPPPPTKEPQIQEKAEVAAATETLTRVDNPPPPVSSEISAAQAAYWPEPPRNMGGAARFSSIAGVDHPLYLIPTSYPLAGQGYYAAVPRVMAAPVGYDNAGRAVYYASSAVPDAYKTVSEVGVTAADCAKIVKPTLIS